jgi:serine/threonine protein kinase
MKYLNVGEAVQRALTREVQVMKNMNSESVIKLYDHFQLDAYLYIVMEYSPMGDLEGFIRKKGQFDLDSVSHMMTELGTNPSPPPSPLTPPKFRHSRCWFLGSLSCSPRTEVSAIEINRAS